jgi:hypothetical protein
VRIFDGIRDGNVPDPITLRATDYLRREAEALNAMLTALRAREAELQVLRERAPTGA